MSTDAERAAAEKAEADKKAAEDAAAATKAAASAWPTGGYNSFIPLLIIFILAVLAVCVDLSTVFLVRACLDQSQYVINLVNVMLVIYPWINLIEKLPICSTKERGGAGGEETWRGSRLIDLTRETSRISCFGRWLCTTRLGLNLSHRFKIGRYIRPEGRHIITTDSLFYKSREVEIEIAMQHQKWWFL